MSDRSRTAVDGLAEEAAELGVVLRERHGQAGPVGLRVLEGVVAPEAGGTAEARARGGGLPADLDDGRRLRASAAGHRERPHAAAFRVERRGPDRTVTGAVQ